MSDKVQLGDEEWRARLTPEQYRILRKAGTEPPFSGALLHVKEEGEFRCAGCGEPLFDQPSGAKQRHGSVVCGRRYRDQDKASAALADTGFEQSGVTAVVYRLEGAAVGRRDSVRRGDYSAGAAARSLQCLRSHQVGEHQLDAWSLQLDYDRGWPHQRPDRPARGHELVNDAGAKLAARADYKHRSWVHRLVSSATVPCLRNDVHSPQERATICTIS